MEWEEGIGRNYHALELQELGGFALGAHARTHIVGLFSWGLFVTPSCVSFCLWYDKMFRFLPRPLPSLPQLHSARQCCPYSLLPHVHTRVCPSMGALEFSIMHLDNDFSNPAFSANLIITSTAASKFCPRNRCPRPNIFILDLKSPVFSGECGP